VIAKGDGAPAKSTNRLCARTRYQEKGKRTGEGKRAGTVRGNGEGTGGLKKPSNIAKSNV